MDKSVFHTLCLRAWGLVAGFAATVAVPLFVTPEVQGVYFTFFSILSIQIFFELGLGQVLLNRFAFLNQRTIHSLDPDDASLQDLLYSARFIYRAMALLFWLFAMVAGWIFFSYTAPNGLNWIGPWFLLVTATSINLLQSVKLTYLESIGWLHIVSIARLKISFLATLSFLIVLASGGGLWAAPVVAIINSLFFSVWIYYSEPSLPYRTARVKVRLPFANVLDLWRDQVLPMQWRISLSWASGYLIFQLYTPVVMVRFGPVEAGKLGFLISIMSSLMIVATTFTSALAPKLASLFASNKIREYHTSYMQSMLCSVPALTVSLILLPPLLTLSSFNGALFAERLPSVLNIILYGFSAFFSGLVYLISIYLRAQQQEPFLWLSIGTAAFMLPAILVFSTFSLSSLLVASMLVNMGSFFWALSIFSSNQKSIAQLP